MTCSPALRLRLTGAQHMPAPTAPARAGGRAVPPRPYPRRMAILRVEPLTTARALRGPVRLPPAGGDGGARGRQRRPRAVRAAPAARRRRRARRDLGAAAGAARRADRGARGGRPAGAGRARPLGRPRVLLDPLARPAAGAAAGDRDRRGRTVRAKVELRARDPAGRRGGAERRRAGSGSSSGRCWRRCAPARCRAPSWPPRSAPTARRCAGWRSAA